jgi:hypothetical protein
MKNILLWEVLIEEENVSLTQLFIPALQIQLNLLISVLSLCNTSVIHSVVQTNLPQDTCFSALLSTIYIRPSALEITTLSVGGSNIIFQGVGCFKNATLSSSLRRQAVYSLR